MRIVLTADCGRGDADAVSIDAGTRYASADCNGPSGGTGVVIGFNETVVETVGETFCETVDENNCGTDDKTDDETYDETDIKPVDETGDKAGDKCGNETRGETVDRACRETGSKTGGETVDKTGCKTGGETDDKPVQRPVMKQKTRLSTKTLMWARFAIRAEIRSTKSPVAGLIRRSTKNPMLTLAVDPTARPMTTPAPVTTQATRPATTRNVKLAIKVIRLLLASICCYR